MGFRKGVIVRYSIDRHASITIHMSSRVEKMAMSTSISSEICPLRTLGAKLLMRRQDPHTRPSVIHPSIPKANLHAFRFPLPAPRESVKLQPLAVSAH